MRLMCGTTLSKAEQRAVSRLSVTRWCACHIYVRLGSGSVHVVVFADSIARFSSRLPRPVRSSQFRVRTSVRRRLGNGAWPSACGGPSRLAFGSGRHARPSPHPRGPLGHMSWGGGDMLTRYWRCTRRVVHTSSVQCSRRDTYSSQRDAAPHWHSLSHTVHRQHRTERLNPEAA